MWLEYLDQAGVAVAAVTGCLAAARTRMDLFGALVFAVLTAVGGGTLRDLLLGAPVFWVGEPHCVALAVGVGAMAFVWMRLARVPRGALAVADAFALGIFTVVGADKALGMGVHPWVAVAMGPVTGVAGGAARDVLSGRPAAVLMREVYATASLFGAALLVALSCAGGARLWAWVLGGGVTVALRLAALRYDLGLPLAVARE